MTDLGPTSRALIDAARGGIAPDAGAAARVRAKVAAAIAGAGVAATSGAHAPASPVAAPASGASTAGVVIKLSAVVLIGGAIVGAILAGRSSEPPASAPVAMPAVAIDEAPSTDVRVAAPDGTSEAVRPATMHPATGHVRPDPVRPDPAPPAAARPAVDPARDLGREVELIDLATAAEHDGRYDDALAAIRIYAAEIGERGQLAEEAAAIEIEVACRLHGDVAGKLAAFDRRWPSSAQRARLTAACARR